ncbi:MAG TPA: hypothetical protein VGO73_05400 [Pyrinomonadaceae bacterium]|jgi:hypothetical protein|nr:hypothetical protein [Pyrinomonadaceae bacterium]
MTLRKKLLLVLLVLLLLSQIPFAYRRYKLGRLHAAIQELNSGRSVTQANDGLAEFKGVVHVHSFLGGHSTGNFEDLISAARSNQLDFVVMTEHPSNNFNTAEMTLKGEHDGVLFINGNEVRTANGDRLLLLPGDALAGSDDRRSTQEVLARRSAGLALVAYPQEFKSWGTEQGERGYNGIEVYNVYTNAREINPLVMFFDGLWSYRSYPDLLFANFYRRPAESLKKWDGLVNQKDQKFVATAGNDAHANVGISLNDSTGKTLLGLKLDPYERSFRLVRLHVLLDDRSRLNGQLGFPSFDEGRLLNAISAGHCFIGFDLFGDTSGFRFMAHDADENKIMGDEIKLGDQVSLSISVPVPARVMLLRDGAQIQEATGVTRMDFVAKEKGSYRVEVYLPQLPKPAGDQPWIISNPIYVR